MWDTRGYPSGCVGSRCSKFSILQCPAWHRHPFCFFASATARAIPLRMLVLLGNWFIPWFSGHHGHGHLQAVHLFHSQIFHNWGALPVMFVALVPQYYRYFIAINPSHEIWHLPSYPHRTPHSNHPENSPWWIWQCDLCFQPQKNLPSKIPKGHRNLPFRESHWK